MNTKNRRSRTRQNQGLVWEAQRLAAEARSEKNRHLAKRANKLARKARQLAAE